jgi:tetratricopeptide (TPR) repeat protein
MPNWWPFRKEPKEDPETLYRQAAQALQEFYDDQTAAGLSRQAILQHIQMQLALLEQQAPTPAIKAQLRAYDGFHEQLRQSILFNLSAGKQHEVAGELEQAVAHYEMAVQDQASTRFPYEHLRIIYRRNNYLEDALRICQTAVENPFLSEQDRAHFQSWAEKLQTQIEEATK